MQSTPISPQPSALSKGENHLTNLHPAFDWREVARLALSSRIMDNLEESELAPQGLVTYQFSAKGHELGQILIGQCLTQPHDAAAAYYRSRPFMLSSGLTLEEALAADMSRAGNISDGRDVGVTFNLPRRGKALVIPMAGDVGSGYTPAAGWAQSIRYHTDVLNDVDWATSIAVAFGGDGSVAANGFWSGLTIATTLKLPMLFVVEDNGYAISVTGPAQTPGANIAENLASFKNLKIISGSGTIPAETADLVTQAVEYVRGGHGPALLYLKVPRLSGHTGIDTQAYKTPDLLEEERSRDPIPALRQYLVPALMSTEEWDALSEQVRQQVLAAAEAAKATPLPDVNSITRYAFADPEQPQQVGGLVATSITMPQGSDTPAEPTAGRIGVVEAIRRTLDYELSINPRLLIFGEDVGEKGGVHAVTDGLMKKYGDQRVFDTSLSEEGIVGRAAGMAYAGLMPVPELQFRKYADPATEQIHNAGTVRWRTANKFAAPMVIRMPGGYRKIGDPWHSVTSEIDFAHAVGWHVAFPSNAEDAVGLLRTALRGNDPVIFFEHRYLLDAAVARRPYPGDEYVIPFGKANIIQPGNDLTIVTWGAMVERCELAAKEIDASIEIIDLRTISPWDSETVLASVRKTSKCLIVHEDIASGGFGAEIAATIMEQAFMYLDGPVLRIGAPRVPVPFNTTLMDGVVPTKDLIKEKLDYLLSF
jgi:2-oxoisovalerate dehydrogenase E1 component